MGRGSSAGGGPQWWKHDPSWVTRFNDKAIEPPYVGAGFAFMGADLDQMDFFISNSNMTELISDATELEQEAFDWYTRGGLMGGQLYEKDGFDNLDGEQQKYVVAMEKMLDKTNLLRSVEVVRLSDAQLVLGKGSKTGSLEDFKGKEGQVVTSKSFLSFSAASEGLHIEDKTKAVEYRLKIKNDTKGAGMYLARLSAWGTKQREFMVNSDSAFKIGKTTYDKSKNKFIVNLEYLGHEQHEHS